MRAARRSNRGRGSWARCLGRGARKRERGAGLGEESAGTGPGTRTGPGIGQRQGRARGRARRGPALTPHPWERGMSFPPPLRAADGSRGGEDPYTASPPFPPEHPGAPRGEPRPGGLCPPQETVTKSPRSCKKVEPAIPSPAFHCRGREYLSCLKWMGTAGLTTGSWGGEDSKRPRSHRELGK